MGRLSRKSFSTQRVRDPVHGLIVFEDDGYDAPRDRIAWRLLNTPEMQRLRRIRQLGVSEFTFPGATHTRFAHSLGVFHVSRQLARILKKFVAPAEWKNDSAEVAIFAALLHDIGHGPFSHAFEEVQKERGEKKRHEAWTADLILSETGSIRPILEERRRGMAQDVADLLRAEVPENPYHAIVSSSFDADRLDYLRRDRMMTGSGAGAIDFDWLLDNLVLGDISIGTDDDESGETLRTFCLRRKALQSAESFLLARYHLFEQVYLHKTTRGMEKLVGRVLGMVADAAAKGEAERIGLDSRDPLIVFFGPEGGGNDEYLALDDTAVWAAASRIARGGDEASARMARRLVNRERLFCLDIEACFPRREREEPEAAANRWREKEALIDAEIEREGSVVKDSVKLSAYGEVGADQTRAHKRLAILVDEGPPREITALSDLVRALPRRELVRYYFESERDRERIMDKVK